MGTLHDLESCMVFPFLNANVFFIFIAWFFTPSCKVSFSYFEKYRIVTHA